MGLGWEVGGAGEGRPQLLEVTIAFTKEWVWGDGSGCEWLEVVESGERG